MPEPDDGTAASLAHDNASYCLSVLGRVLQSARLVRGAVGSMPLASVHSAGQLVAGLLAAYPLSVAQRAMLDCDCEQDFAIAAAPNCVALVLCSVLGNALRALAGHAAPRLLLRVQGNGADGPQIAISDNGPGIAPEVLQRVLAGPVTTHGQSGASGWGLLFCQRIMQSLGGRIRVHSQFGHSTTVTLYFPAL